jgi:hypothetical protein
MGSSVSPCLGGVVGEGQAHGHGGEGGAGQRAPARRVNQNKHSTTVIGA